MWKMRKRGYFSVKTFYKHLTRGEGSGFVHFAAKQFWKTKASPRVTFFAWEVSREYILTIDRLMRTGKTMVNRCFLCKMDAESCNHILLWRPIVYSIWLVYGLLGINGRFSEG